MYKSTRRPECVLQELLPGQGPIHGHQFIAKFSQGGQHNILFPRDFITIVQTIAACMLSNNASQVSSAYLQTTLPRFGTLRLCRFPQMPMIKVNMTFLSPPPLRPTTIKYRQYEGENDMR